LSLRKADRVSDQTPETTMNEAVLILPNMRGGCATVDGRVHTLFRVTSRKPRPMARPDGAAIHPPAEQRR
jgi:hypothetical protein